MDVQATNVSAPPRFKGQDSFLIVLVRMLITHILSCALAIVQRGGPV